MQTATIEEVQAHLPEMIKALGAEEELVILSNGQPVARLKPEGVKRVPVLGTGKGTVLYMAPDFDAPLEEFKEYME